MAMTDWLIECTACNVGIVKHVDELKNKGKSEKSIFKSMSEESDGLYSSGAIRQRYKYYKGDYEKEAKTTPTATDSDKATGGEETSPPAGAGKIEKAQTTKQAVADHMNAIVKAYLGIKKLEDKTQFNEMANQLREGIQEAFDLIEDVKSRDWVAGQIGSTINAIASESVRPKTESKLDTTSNPTPPPDSARGKELAGAKSIEAIKLIMNLVVDQDAMLGEMIRIQPKTTGVMLETMIPFYPDGKNRTVANHRNAYLKKFVEQGFIKRNGRFRLEWL